MNKWFNDFASKISSITGRSYTFTIAIIIILIWAITGPFLGFSDTWQLIINTLTTLITFLMVFIIQNTQNKNDISQQIKLDTLLKIGKLDTEEIIRLETMEDKELEKIVKDIQERKK